MPVFLQHQSIKYIVFFSILITTNVLYLYLYLPPETKSICKKDGSEISQPQWLEIFDFLPYGERDCKKLFKNMATGRNLSPLSEHYLLASRNHSAEVHKLIKDRKPLEGFSAQIQEEIIVYWKFASLNFVKTICETGFNAGHSTLVWLTAQPDTKVYSFDLGAHYYARPMAQYLQQLFPGRLTVTWGDSRKTLPVFSQMFPNVECDLVVIDGGHTTDIATADFDNFRQMVKRDNIIMFDDYPSGFQRFQQRLGAMWERKKRTGEVLEIFECGYGPNSMRGFSIGRIQP